ncbi:MAG: beta galactosidase jelly roll domain-containing protein [Myxococcota bacterium]|nr:beta galactosidase jelly roll domain-containing protein [Myxococcota bacterium]
MTPEGWAPRVFLRLVLLLAVGCGGAGTKSESTDGGSGPGDDASAGKKPDASPANSSGDAASGGPMSTPLVDGDALSGAESGPASVPGADAASPGFPSPDGGVPPPVLLPATDRTRVPLGDGWKFMASNSLTGAEAVAFNDTAWPTVSVPHTWDSVTAPSNAIASYTSSWYRRTFSLTAADTQKRVYVYFEGVFQVADVYVNGKHLGQHRGGYTRFLFDATAAVSAGANVLAVQVSNGSCPDCLPDGNTRLNKGYGGVYRKAWLLTANRYHVATTDYASSGVYVTPSHVGPASSTVDTRVLLTNDGPADKPFHVTATVDDPAGNAVLTSTSDVVVKSGTTAAAAFTGTVSNPRLWGPGYPNLYTMSVTLTVDGALTDAVGEYFGFRSYQLTTSDFVLNGNSTPLRGMGKHQETEHHASAVTDQELIEDWDNLQEMGANYVRLVHYPHAELEYQLADRRGIMVWSESGHTNGGPPTPNGDSICREMVFQNWNHPSIIFWSAGNEGGGVFVATSHYAAVLKATDPSRPVVYAGPRGQHPANVDFTFVNRYDGWYPMDGTMYDQITAPDPWVSESGAGSVIAIQDPDVFAMNHTVNFFEPEGYADLVHEVRFDDLFRHPNHVPAFAGFVFRDIPDVGYPGIFAKYKHAINTKGLVTLSGYKKDSFYLFKSFLRKSPVVHLVGPHYFLRSANAAGQGPIKAYSNAAVLTLTVNGAPLAPMANDQYKHPPSATQPAGTPIKNVFLWPNALAVGKNVIRVADGSGTTDTMTVYYRGTGTALPPDAGARVSNLTASNGPAYFMDVPISDQRPFYVDFDGTGDNAFDVVPAAAAGASFIATRRQSDSMKRTDLAFDLPNGGDVFVMFTKQTTPPAWVTGGGFADTGATGQWRDNTPKLVDYSLYKKTLPPAAHVALATSAIDYVVLVK